MITRTTKQHDSTGTPFWEITAGDATVVVYKKYSSEAGRMLYTPRGERAGFGTLAEVVEWLSADVDEDSQTAQAKFDAARGATPLLAEWEAGGGATARVYFDGIGRIFLDGLSGYDIIDIAPFDLDEHVDGRVAFDWDEWMLTDEYGECPDIVPFGSVFRINGTTYVETGLVQLESDPEPERVAVPVTLVVRWEQIAAYDDHGLYWVDVNPERTLMRTAFEEARADGIVQRITRADDLDVALDDEDVTWQTDTFGLGEFGDVVYIGGAAYKVTEYEDGPIAAAGVPDVCGAIRTATGGSQTCQQPKGHEGAHRSQDGYEWFAAGVYFGTPTSVDIVDVDGWNLSVRIADDEVMIDIDDTEDSHMAAVLSLDSALAFLDAAAAAIRRANA